MKATVKNLLNSSTFHGNGKYYLIENGSGKYRNTPFGNFNKNNEFFKIVGSGNDAPRGGKVGDFVIVQFTEEFLKIAETYLTEKRQAEQAVIDRRNEEIAKVDNYASMIEYVENEDYVLTAGRLSLAIGERIESHIFNKAVKMVRSRKNNN